MATIIKRPGKKAVTYRAVIRCKGIKPITGTFKTRKAAKDWAKKIEGNTDLQGLLGGPGSRRTLGETIDKFMGQYTGTDRTLPQLLDYWKANLGDWKLSAITQDVITEVLDRLREDPALQPLRHHAPRNSSRTRSGATINRYHTALSGIFTFAKVKDNPCHGIEKQKEVHRFGRCATEDEELDDGTIIEGERTRLLRTCKQSAWSLLYLLVIMAFSTGGRLSELMRLTWGDIDLGKSIARLRTSKNGEPRVLPLIPEVVTEIKKLPRPIDSTTFLFRTGSDPHTNAYHSFRAHWVKALKDAGIENFRFHDLRHSCASYLTEKGVPLVVVAEILGHKSLAMVQRYSHVHTRQKAKVVNEVFKDLLG